MKELLYFFPIPILSPLPCFPLSPPRRSQEPPSPSELAVFNLLDPFWHPFTAAPLLDPPRQYPSLFPFLPHIHSALPFFLFFSGQLCLPFTLLAGFPPPFTSPLLGFFETVFSSLINDIRFAVIFVSALHFGSPPVGVDLFRWEPAWSPPYDLR